MTHLPTDPIDPYEARLAGRVHDHADQALAPFDATAIAHAAAVAHPRRRFGRVFGASTAVGRLGWIAAAGLLAAATIGVTLGAGGKGPSGPVAVATASPTASPAAIPTTAPTAVPTPVPTVRPIQTCGPSDLSLRVVSWNGAAGQRIATLRLTNTSAVACTFPTITRPELLDRTHRVLLEGAKPGAAKQLTLGPGKSLGSMAQDSNYCGPTPVAPVTVAIVLVDGQKVVATPVTPTDTSGVPPCNGAGNPGFIEMQAWAP
ncbi:MAG TPA: DUF4232 domain-containing protein [Candidatus Limnocylindrales bacterium]|nr:DUF4232 domain-containing protein [Candidatus Limnocylindrales bacterium]